MELTQEKGELRDERREQDRVLMTLFDIQLCLKLDHPLDHSAKWLKSKTLTPQMCEDVGQQELIHD